MKVFYPIIKIISNIFCVKEKILCILDKNKNGYPSIIFFLKKNTKTRQLHICVKCNIYFCFRFFRLHFEIFRIIAKILGARPNNCLRYRRT